MCRSGYNIPYRTKFSHINVPGSSQKKCRSGWKVPYRTWLSHKICPDPHHKCRSGWKIPYRTFNSSIICLNFHKIYQYGWKSTVQYYTYIYLKIRILNKNFTIRIQSAVPYFLVVYFVWITRNTILLTLLEWGKGIERWCELPPLYNVKLSFWQVSHWCEYIIHIHHISQGLIHSWKYFSS